jgi:NADP+-dependent farnesol dehydrogenase
MVLSMDRWVGKVAVVTGASSGIGAGISEFLVDQGLIVSAPTPKTPITGSFQVVGLARRSELVEELAKKLTGKKGQLHAVKADVSNEEDVVKAFKWVEDNLGHVHILINNAGVAKENFLCATETPPTGRPPLDVNVLGLCIATREAVKSMTANNINGHIIHINSVAGHKIPNFPGINIYTASKHAVTALAETLRQEFNHLGSKIKITVGLSSGVADLMVFCRV